MWKNTTLEVTFVQVLLVWKIELHRSLKRYDRCDPHLCKYVGPTTKTFFQGVAILPNSEYWALYLR